MKLRVSVSAMHQRSGAWIRLAQLRVARPGISGTRKLSSDSGEQIDGPAWDGPGVKKEVEESKMDVTEESKPVVTTGDEMQVDEVKTEEEAKESQALADKKQEQKDGMYTFLA